MERPMKQNDDLSRSLIAFDQASTLVAVVELGSRSWLVAGLVPGLSRQPLKKLNADAQALLTLLRRWQGEATKTGSTVNRIVVAFEAGRRLLACALARRRAWCRPAWCCIRRHE
jgi:transposase